jgi:hypothetical protein
MNQLVLLPATLLGIKPNGATIDFTPFIVSVGIWGLLGVVLIGRK